MLRVLVSNRCGSRGKKSEHDVVVSLAKRNLGLSEIARIVGVSRQAVFIILKNYGIETNNRKIRSLKKEEEIKKLIKDGKSYEDIMFSVEVPYNKVKAVAKSCGIILPSRNLKFDGEKAIQMSQDGYSVSEIAAALDTRYYNILNFLRRKGISIVSLRKKRSITFDPDMVIEMAKNGYPIHEIAEKTKARSQNIRLFLDRRGITYIRGSLNQSEMKSESRKVESLFLSGKSRKEIASELNYTEDLVDKLLAFRKKQDDTR